MKRLYFLFSFVCLLLLSSCEKDNIIYSDQCITDLSFGKRGGTKTIVITNERYYFNYLASIQNIDTKVHYLSQRKDADYPNFAEGDGITASVEKPTKITVTVEPSTEHHLWHLNLSCGDLTSFVIVTQN